MKRFISLGMNCEVSFQIERYAKEWKSSLYSWAFIMDDDLFLESLNHIDDIFENEICFHLPTNDMFLDQKYQMTFHGRTTKENFLDENGNITNHKVYEETVEELRARLRHLKENFKKELTSEDEKIYIKKILIEPDLSVWGGAERLTRIIRELSNYFRKAKNAKLVIVMEKKYDIPAVDELEDGVFLFIRYVDFFAPVDDTKDGADNDGWEKIFDEFLGEED